MQKRNIFFIAIVICFSQQAEAQNKITRSVLGSGAIASQSGNHRLLATVGQPMIGISSNTTQIITSGFWKGVVDIATSVEQAEESALPQEFRLEQNYPNPFNPTTTITFTLPQQARVTITLFDILGRQIAILLNEERDSGEYDVNFEGEVLPSGIYFYTMRAQALSASEQDFNDTKKFTLLK